MPRREGNGPGGTWRDAMIPAPPRRPRPMDPRSLPDWFDADRSDFMQSAVSISLGARDARLRSSLGRGLGCRVLPGGEVRVFVDPGSWPDLLRDIAATAQVAVVYSDIVLHRTLQVKAIDARVDVLDADDVASIEAYVSGFTERLLGLGYPRSVPATLLGHGAGNCSAVVFHPHEAFEQTPGPQAGQRLEGAG